jgi:hypothetical protein
VEAVDHLVGGLVGEGEREDAEELVGSCEESSDSFGEDAGLAGAWSCEDDEGAFVEGDNFFLRWGQVNAH